MQVMAIYSSKPDGEDGAIRQIECNEFAKMAKQLAKKQRESQFQLQWRAAAKINKKNVPEKMQEAIN